MKVPRPSDRDLLEGTSTGIKEVRLLGHEDILARMKFVEKEIRELTGILEGMFKEGYLKRGSF